MKRRLSVLSSALAAALACSGCDKLHPHHGSSLHGSVQHEVAVDTPAAAVAPDPHARLEVEASLREIYDALVRGDAHALRAHHSPDWKGFGPASRALGRGLDAYLSSLALGDGRMIRYEISDLVVDVYGPAAAAYYLVTWMVRDPASGREVEVAARAVDVYRLEGAHWLRAGSDLSILPGQG